MVRNVTEGYQLNLQYVEDRMDSAEVVVVEKCKDDWVTRLQKNPQLMLQFVVMIQHISRRILRDQNEVPEGMFYIIY